MPTLKRMQALYRSIEFVELFAKHISIERHLQRLVDCRKPLSENIRDFAVIENRNGSHGHSCVTTPEYPIIAHTTQWMSTV